MAKLGSDPLIAPSDIQVTSSTAQTTVGSRFSTPDGRIYRYVQFGTNTLVAGNLLQGPASIPNHQGVSPTVVSGTGTFLVTLTLGATAATAGQYSNGTLQVVSGAGHLGYSYTVVTNTAAPSSGTQCIVTLAEPLVNAIATGDTVSLTPNVYAGVQQSTTTVRQAPVGVALTNGSANFFGFIQTRGIAAVLSDANVAAVGLPVTQSLVTAGAVGVAFGTTVSLGYAQVLGVSAKTNPVFLQID